MGKRGGLPGLSTNIWSYPQSYPLGCPRMLQTFVRQSTGSTTITNLFKIY